MTKVPNTGSGRPGWDGGQRFGEKLLQPWVVRKRRWDAAPGIIPTPPGGPAGSSSAEHPPVSPLTPGSILLQGRDAGCAAAQTRVCPPAAHPDLCGHYRLSTVPTALPPGSPGADEAAVTSRRA